MSRDDLEEQLRNSDAGQVAQLSDEEYASIEVHDVVPDSDSTEVETDAR